MDLTDIQKNILEESLSERLDDVMHTFEMYQRWNMMKAYDAKNILFDQKSTDERLSELLEEINAIKDLANKLNLTLK